MSTTDLEQALGHVRALTQDYLSGTPKAFEAARTLIAYLLQITVMQPYGVLLMAGAQGQRENVRIIGVPHSRMPVPLRDGRYLDVLIHLQLDAEPDMTKLRVYKAKFQYQANQDGHDWVFRYEYLRTQRDRHAASHLHVRGALVCDGCLPEKTSLEDVHFPTGRMAIEGVIRCLVEEFNVPTATDPAFWRAVLAESENQFIAIAHRAPSGPAA